MRGRDVRRWRVAWAGVWLIATYPALHYDIETFPAVKSYLLGFGMERLEQTGATHVVNNQIVKARKKTHNKWFEVQDSISYWDDFSKPKIVYTDIMSRRKSSAFPAFTYDKEAHITNTAYLISSDTENLLYLLGVLNSKVGQFIIQHFVAQLGDASYRLFAQYVIEFPIVKQPPQEKAISTLVTQLLEAPTPELEAALNALVYEVYGLCEEEKQYLETL